MLTYYKCWTDWTVQNDNFSCCLVNNFVFPFNCFDLEGTVGVDNNRKNEIISTQYLTIFPIAWLSKLFKIGVFEYEKTDVCFLLKNSISYYKTQFFVIQNWCFVDQIDIMFINIFFFIN
jgi:hypothetical protein